MNIAFVSLASWGDCINSTLMLKPLKDRYRDSNLEVHTTTLYESAFHNNPYVNHITTYYANSKSACFDLYNSVPRTVRSKNYDKVLVPAPILYPTKRNSLLHPEFGDNLITTFMRVLEDEGIEYDWPVQTILNLRRDEIDAVASWLRSNSVTMDGRRNILMETHGESGQTFWDHHWTLAVCRHLLKDQHTNLFISRKSLTQEIAHLEKEFRGRAFWAGNLSIRECAELYNRCNIFFSISSGLSNACCTSHCRKPDGKNMRWVETINSPTVNSSPLGSDHKIFWYDNDISKFTNMLIENNI